MPRRNPFEESQPQKHFKGDDIFNTQTRRVTRIIDSAGSAQEFVTGLYDSRPDGNGGFNDIEVTNLITDPAGNIFPIDPHYLIAKSHSGLFITSPEQGALCTSWLHAPSRSRNILLGQDGRLTAKGAICSHCDFWLGTLYVSVGIISLGLVLGIWHGAGLF